MLAMRVLFSLLFVSYCVLERYMFLIAGELGRSKYTAELHGLAISVNQYEWAWVRRDRVEKQLPVESS